jgi:hypothetical protein
LPYRYFSNDTTPPTTPTLHFANDWGSCAEVELSWFASSDNVDDPSLIRYDIYVNDVFEQSLFGTTKTITNGTINGDNTFKIVAVDTTDNQSAPLVFTLNNLSP